MSLQEKQLFRWDTNLTHLWGEVEWDKVGVRSGHGASRHPEELLPPVLPVPDGEVAEGAEAAGRPPHPRGERRRAPGRRLRHGGGRGRRRLVGQKNDECYTNRFLYNSDNQIL